MSSPACFRVETKPHRTMSSHKAKLCTAGSRQPDARWKYIFHLIAVHEIGFVAPGAASKAPNPGLIAGLQASDPDDSVPRPGTVVVIDFGTETNGQWRSSVEPVKLNAFGWSPSVRPGLRRWRGTSLADAFFVRLRKGIPFHSVYRTRCAFLL